MAIEAKENKHIDEARVGWTSLAANILLAVAKLTIGYAAASSAMTADGFNSAGDCVTSLVMLIGQRISSQPSDEDHPHGHGKAEYIFSGLIAMALLAVAWSTLRNSVQSLMRPQPIEKLPALLLVAALTIATKLALYVYANRVGKLGKNPLILALAADHKSDVFVTSGTAVGVIGSFLGFAFLDGVLGILISAVIAKSGVTLLRGAYRVLMDTNEKAGSPLVEATRATVAGCEGIDHLDAITVRPVGTRFAISVKITVPGAMTVLESHRITRRIKDPLMENPDVADVIVHVNPLEEHEGPSVLF